MNRVVINLYCDQWVVASSERSAGGVRLDTQPVRLISHGDKAALGRILRQVMEEVVPTVPDPDWNNPLYKIGVRAQALGLKTWLSFVRNARCFNIEERDGALVLEEWPREGGSFSANAVWEKKFRLGYVEAIAEHLVKSIPLMTKVSRRRQNRLAKPKVRSRRIH